MTLFRTPTCFVPVTCTALTCDKETIFLTEEGGERTAMDSFFTEYNNSNMGLYTIYVSVTSFKHV